uniref:Probable chemoreceptor glutamine deamidase CheD n=1 Tax=Geobacter sp. (strain M21) TaxID=443144 RepID=C6E0N1_GEOSM
MIQHVQSLVFLKPGQMMVSPVPTLVTTLLGSCIAVTLFCPRTRFGAICHAQLPSIGNPAGCSHDDLSHARYVECAVMMMLERLQAHGVANKELQAKVFGGADMFEGNVKRPGVGKQNAEMALKVLDREAVRVLCRDLGGERGRKIVFHTDTGEVLLKRLGKSGVS